MRTSAPRGSIDLYLGLGSNQGDRRAQLEAAVHQLLSSEETGLLGLSSLYESTFVGHGEQAPYLNACIRLKTTAEPAEWLRRCQRLERMAGREPDSHLQPRPLDVDILLYGTLIIRRPDLIVPHPRILSRRFVLEPLAELAPELIVPGHDRTLREELMQPEIQAQRLALRAGPDWFGEGRPWKAAAGRAPS